MHNKEDSKEKVKSKEIIMLDYSNETAKMLVCIRTCLGIYMLKHKDSTYLGVTDDFGNLIKIEINSYSYAD